MKSMSSCGGMTDEKQDGDTQHQVPPSSKKSGRRSKKQQLQQQMENGEMDDNSSEKGLVIAECDNMSYGVSNYDNRSSLIPNYSAFASYMPPTMSAANGNLSHESTAVGSFSSPHNQNHNYNDFYMHHRKYSTLEGMHLGGGGGYTKIDSPHSSADEHSPETSISSASAMRPLSPALPLANGNFRDSLSPSLIASHAILKEDYTTGNDCSSNKDHLAKYNQDPAYRIYSHQLHHHHHYHYPLLASSSAQTPSSSSSEAATSPINYAYQGYSASSGVGIADTDVDPKEMEQYLASDSGRYKKFCYMKPEMPSLTELTPMSSLSSSNDQSYQSSHPQHQVKIDNNENLMQMPSLEPIIASNQPSTYANGYQENLPSSSSAYSAYLNATGASNWINYSI